MRVLTRVGFSSKKRCFVKSMPFENPLLNSRLLGSLVAAFFASTMFFYVGNEASAIWVQNGTQFTVFTNNSPEQGSNLLGTGSGGEFALQHISGGYGNSSPIMRSFAVSTQNSLTNNETVTSGGTFDETEDGDNSAGPGGSSLNPNPLSISTKALFLAFASIRYSTVK